MTRITNKDWHTTKFSNLDQRKVLHRLWELENEQEAECEKAKQSYDDIETKKQKHIEETEQIIWDWLQRHYQESCYTTELGKFTNALCDFWQIYNDNKDEIENLNTKAEILARGVRDLNHENYELTEKIKQAQIGVLSKLREKFFSMSNGWIFMDCIDELIKEIENETINNNVG